MAGDGATGVGFVNIVKMTVLSHSSLNGGVAIVGNNGLGDEQRAVVQIFATGQTLLDIACQALVVLAAILLHNAHLAVTDFDAGLQVQQVCAQSSCGRAAAALNQVIQLVNQEACFHLCGESTEFFCRRIGR